VLWQENVTHPSQLLPGAPENQASSEISGELAENGQLAQKEGSPAETDHGQRAPQHPGLEGDKNYQDAQFARKAHTSKSTRYHYSTWHGSNFSSCKQAQAQYDDCFWERE
jgi:hypothetical protein